jgi:hypothetical protein
MEDIDRRIELAEEIMRRLESGERLSHVLEQTKLLMKMSDKKVQEALMDILMYGPNKAKNQAKIFTDSVYDTAGKKYSELCVYNDVAALKLNVYEMENLRHTPAMHVRMSEEASRQTVLNQRYYAEVKSALDALRSYIYIITSQTWSESLKRKEKR